MKSKTPVLATDLRLTRGSERFVGSNGHINASSDKDLTKQVAAFLKMVSESGAVTPEVAASREQAAAARRASLEMAFTSQEAHRELGEVVAEELYQAANREGFMRRFLARQDIKQGQFPYVKMRMKNNVATIATSPVQVQSQLIRDNTYTPPEFYIVSRPFVEEREIQQSPGDVLDEKFQEAQEGIMVAEDRLWRNMAVSTVNMANPLTQFIGTMTAGGLMTLRNQVSRWNIPVTSFLIANDVWTDIVSDASFQAVIDQVSKYELLMTGQLGEMFGMGILSDAYRHPEQKVLSQGEMFAIGDPINHGQYTDRGGVTSQPTDITTEKIPGRGWAFSELMSMVIANARSVARATRS
jgi:hypothetical protein